MFFILIITGFDCPLGYYIKKIMIWMYKHMFKLRNCLDFSRNIIVTLTQDL